MRDAVETCRRPIAMSVLTTICGLAPLLLSGEGVALYRGVGVIVLFGLFGTAAVTLTFLPALTAMVLGSTASHPAPPVAAEPPSEVESRVRCGRPRPP